MTSRGTSAPRKRAKPIEAAPVPAPAPVAFNSLRHVMWSRPGFLIRRLHQISDALFLESCHTNNITTVQFGVLTALSMNPWLDQKTIANELALDRTTTTEVLKRLEEKGMIERRVNPDDRRSKLSVITKHGLKTVRNLDIGMQTSQAAIIAPLPEADQKLFMRLIAELVELHEKATDGVSQRPTPTKIGAL